MRATLLIAWKDLRQRARDRSAFLIAIVVPLALAFIFSQILGDVSNDSLTFAFAVVDEDGGTPARAFMDEVLAPLEDEGLIVLTVADSAESGRRLAEDGEVNATFILPAGFSAAVESGQGAEIEVVGNVDAPIGTMVASSIARSFANQLTSIQTSVATVASSGGSDPAAIPAIAARAAATPDPVTFEDVSATRKELDPGTFYAAGMAVFFMFFTVQFGISSLLDERREGTMKRLLVAPIRRSSIFFGKLGASFVLGVISMAVLAVGTSLLLGAEWGDPVGVGLLIVAGVVAAMAVMALVATVARTAEQAGNWQAIVGFGLGMLGGSFFPVAQAGGLIGQLSLITPHAWFLRGLGDLQAGGGVVEILPAVAAILGFAAVTGAVAFLRRERLVAP
jgi:ABC-2 type transport system permease protein